jgi:hypothetical protein
MYKVRDSLDGSRFASLLEVVALISKYLTVEDRIVFFQGM